jgi:CheY-like chemotaxis protein
MFWFYFTGLFPVALLVILFLYDRALADRRASGSTGCTILLVDDNNTVCEVIGKQLRRLGFTVLPAQDVQSALSLADGRTDIDLLIVDVVMPRMSGPQLAERVRARRPSLPVLFISGMVHQANLPSDESGKMAFLRKPFQFATLREQVDRMMEAGRRCAA